MVYFKTIDRILSVVRIIHNLNFGFFRKEVLYIFIVNFGKLEQVFGLGFGLATFPGMIGAGGNAKFFGYFFLGKFFLIPEPAEFMADSHKVKGLQVKAHNSEEL
jgi:hypothetical protein